MKNTFNFLISFCILISHYTLGETTEYRGSSAQSVWEIIKEEPYFQLPSDKVGFKSLFDGAISLIERSTFRTLNDQSDIIPYFNKLAHPNGVCLKGNWKITVENPYSGYFKKDSNAIIIARASVALNETEEGKLRGFGLAGKIFPTAYENEVVKTGNFFLADDLGGTKALHYTDVEMTNEPKVTKTMAFFKNLRYAIKIASTFKKFDSNPTIRQLYEISELNKASSEPLKTPKWMMVKAKKDLVKINEADFRNELRIENYSGDLEFEIYVANFEVNKKKDWKKIGLISFSESVASVGCDHRLHFHHPKWRTDLN